MILIAAAALLAGCAGPAPKSDIATVNITQITANWPKFINYNNQITADAAAIERAREPEAKKQQQRVQLQQRYVRLQGEVTDDVRAAAEQIAKEKNFTMVFTREFVGYGGTDITGDVEKALKIVERPSPKP